MTLPPADPPVPLRPLQRWPQYEEVRGVGRKVVLIFLQLVSGVGYLGMTLSLYLEFKAVLDRHGDREFSGLFYQYFALGLYAVVAANLCLLQRSRRRARSWGFLAVLVVMDVAAGGVSLGYRLEWDTLMDHEVDLFYAALKIGFPLLALGALLGLQWLPLVEGWRPGSRDGEKKAELPVG